jgi:hypothetical protein
MLVIACFGAALGCGARTDTLFDDGDGTIVAGFGGTSFAGTGGGVGVAGSASRAGSGAGGSGTGGTFGSSGFGGFITTGGTLGTAGFGSAGSPFGGSFGTAGSFGTGGVGTGGFGVGGFSGSVSAGGFGGVAGSSIAGAGGSGGIVDLCVGASQTACNKCVCQSCGSELDSCFTDIGCALIFACFAQTQCNGLGCYQASTCRPIIDQFGGLTGPAVGEVFSLATCAATSQTNCKCN